MSTRRFRPAALALMGALASCGCEAGPFSRPALNPFTDLLPLEVSDQAQRLPADITPLGRWSAGDVLEFFVSAPDAQGAYVLIPDELSRTADGEIAAGIVVGGGQIGAAFQYRLRADGDLYLFVNEPSGGSVVFRRGDPLFAPPPAQAVVVQFAQGFLSRGLFREGTDDADDRAFLKGIEPLVQDEIVESLRRIYEGYPIEILDVGNPVPSVFSVLSYRADRQPGTGLDDARAGGADADDTLFNVNPFPPGCRERVILGEVEGVRVGVDVGNQFSDDVARVYVGSFRAPDACDPGFVVGSVNNIINVLATSGAHEIGHLLGLNHSAVDGIMVRELSLSFQRQLQLQRTQIVLDTPLAGNNTSFDQRSSFLYNNVIQDPDVYFEHIFSADLR